LLELLTVSPDEDVLAAALAAPDVAFAPDAVSCGTRKEENRKYNIFTWRKFRTC